MERSYERRSLEKPFGESSIDQMNFLNLTAARFVSVYLILISIGTVVLAQQQYFRTVPRDVKVHEGGEAMLECEVANLAGQVQWTKDGFALGSFNNEC